MLDSYIMVYRRSYGRRLRYANKRARLVGASWNNRATGIRYRRMRRKFNVYVQRQTRVTNTVEASLNGTAYADFTQFESGTSDMIYSMKFSLDKLPNYTEYTALYDTYKIVGVRITLFPAANTNEIQSTTDVPGFAATAIDYDDTTGMSSMSDLMQYDTYKYHAIMRTKPIKRYVRPMISMPVYNASVVSGYGASRSPWIDCQNANVAHYGIIFGLTDASVTSIQKFRLQVKYYMKFRNTR